VRSVETVTDGRLVRCSRPTGPQVAHVDPGASDPWGAGASVPVMLIESADRAQYEAINAIYGHHVVAGFATFDEEPPALAGRLDWFEQFGPAGPHQLRVATEDGQVLGYACSQPYRTHPAFERTVEFSVYLDPAAVGRGLGRLLYDDLITRVAAEGVRSVVTGVALPNDASVALHRSCGFREVGTFRNYAEKHGRVISSVWFQLELAAGYCRCDRHGG
jgi:phosphinothricin acetyltransferase